MPAARHSPSRSAASGAIASISHSSASGGTIATASSRVLASGLTRAMRASTASRTVGGVWPSPAASTSVTKKGLPAVVR